MNRKQEISIVSPDIETYKYGAYGDPEIHDASGALLESSAAGNPFLYTGQMYDAETGFYYYKARYYHPTLGRFLQRDPLGYVDGYNLYAYTANNPINWIDPLGLAKKLSEIKNQNTIASWLPNLPDPVDEVFGKKGTKTDEKAFGGTRVEQIQVGFEYPKGWNVAGHSFIKIDSDVYDITFGSMKGVSVSKEGITLEVEAVGRHRSTQELLSDFRKEVLVAIPVTASKKESLKENLEKTVGRGFNYDYRFCNCADFVEDQLGKIGINLPRDDEIFGIDTPSGTLRQAGEYETRQRR